MNTSDIYNAAQLIECIQQVGFLPLLDSGIWGYSAEEMVTEDCRYVTFPDGGWDWPLWKWKGPIVTEGNCMYGKFFNKKAGFVSREWWPDLCNYRRSARPAPTEESIEESILLTLEANESLITGESDVIPKKPGDELMSGSFIVSGQAVARVTAVGADNYASHINNDAKAYKKVRSDIMESLDIIVKTFNVVYPEESFQRMLAHLRTILPQAEEKKLKRILL